MYCILFIHLPALESKRGASTPVLRRFLPDSLESLFWGCKNNPIADILFLFISFYFQIARTVGVRKSNLGISREMFPSQRRAPILFLSGWQQDEAAIEMRGGGNLRRSSAHFLFPRIPYEHTSLLRSGPRKAEDTGENVVALAVAPLSLFFASVSGLPFFSLFPLASSRPQSIFPAF